MGSVQSKAQANDGVKRYIRKTERQNVAAFETKPSSLVALPMKCSAVLSSVCIAVV